MTELMRGFRVLPPPGERLLPLVTALLLVFSLAPAGLLLPPFFALSPFFVFIALVPFLIFIAELPPSAAGRRSAARAGYFLGLVYFGLLLYWLVAAIAYYSALAVPAYILSVLILAGFTAGVGAGLHFLLQRTTVPLALGAAVLWTAAEWAQGNLHDLAFPWLGLGTALAGYPRVAGAADLVGARGLTFWLALVNGLLATCIMVWRARRRGARAGARARGARHHSVWRSRHRARSPGAGGHARRETLRQLVVTGALTGIIVAAPTGYGFWRAAILELRPAARVAVVQPNIPEELKLDRSAALDTSMLALTNLTRTIESGSVDLIVWPEVAVPDSPEQPARSWLLARVRDLSRDAGAPIFMGAYGLEVEPNGRTTFFNSAFLVDPAGVVGGQRYDKQRLVPFVERIPFIDPARVPWLVDELRHFGGLGRGRGTPVFVTAEAGFGVLICFESIFGGLSREFRTAGADYLLNITNDAWFGREPVASRTTALWQHPAHLVMRAIETRTGIARAANTGVSMFVDPLGRAYEASDLFVPDVRIATVFTTDETTLYARWGDWLATAATLAAILMLAWARFRPVPGSGAPRAFRDEDAARTPTDAARTPADRMRSSTDATSAQ